METEIQSRHLGDQVREVDLPAVAAQTWQQLEQTTTAYTSRTLLKQPGIRVVLLTMAQGARIPAHRADVDITVLILSGKIHFGVGDEVLELGRGRLLAVARGLPHALVADEDSEVLLTLGG